MRFSLKRALINKPEGFNGGDAHLFTFLRHKIARSRFIIKICSFIYLKCFSTSTYTKYVFFYIMKKIWLINSNYIPIVNIFAIRRFSIIICMMYFVTWMIFIKTQRERCLVGCISCLVCSEWISRPWCDASDSFCLYNRWVATRWFIQITNGHDM